MLSPGDADSAECLRASTHTVFVDPGGTGWLRSEDGKRAEASGDPPPEILCLGDREIRAPGHQNCNSTRLALWGSSFLQRVQHLHRLKTLLPSRLRALARWAQALIKRSVPARLRRHPDLARRGVLVAHFGVQGTFFGLIYALFYLGIDHRWGAGVIGLCSVVFAAVPRYLQKTGDVDGAGQALVATMAAGFTALSVIEGGMHGHAVAWLAAVPLCSLLVSGTRAATGWLMVCLMLGASLAVATLSGVSFRPLYDPKWTPLVDSAGNLGIIAFLFILGIVFESSRQQAFNRMQASLDDLAASNERLAHLNNEKTEFLGMAAHDLRNPLTSVIGFAEFVARDSTPQTAELGEIIIKAGTRMLDLINDLLDANAIEAGAYASHLEDCEFGSLLAHSLENNRLSAERKGIQLEVERTACWVQADRKAALQVLDNLVSNAIKYSPPQSSVWLKVSESGAWGEFTVKDSGPGISEADQKKLFLKHTRLTAKPTAGESSVGLGLSIAKRLTESMGGLVTCTSKVGEGATFALRLRRVVVPPTN